MSKPQRQRERIRCFSRSRFHSAVVLALALVPHVAWGEDTQTLLAQASRSALEFIRPSIVQIETLGGLEKVGDQLAGTAPTTGMIVSEDGYIISSAFNFISKPATILVALPGGEKRPAEIVARDRSRMLVLLKVETDESLQVPQAVPPSDVQVGQWAIAVGHTYDTDQPSISLGIISAKNRIWGRALQTDAKVSPVNYGGPLIDLSGRVIGVLVPLSAENQSEVAGAELYDGGIGFAVPFEDIQRLLPTMIDGQDVYPGLMGITLKNRDLYALGPPEIGTCPARSPAAEAGLKKGDKIAEINGTPINSRSQMKHLLGPLNAGEEITVSAVRDGKRFDVQFALVEKVDPYVMPFLGVLPTRGPSAADRPQPDGGIRIRHVFADSAADRAGLKPGDELVALGDEQPQGLNAWRQSLAAYEPGDTVEISFVREGNTEAVTATLTSIPEGLVRNLPDARPATTPTDSVATGIVSIKLPEEPNECHALVPDTYNEDVEHGILLCFPPPGEFDKDAFLKRWQELAAARDLIVVAVLPRNDKRWQRSELEVARKMLNRVRSKYQIDTNRIVVHGYQSGGAMAFGFAFANRDVTRGIGVVDAVVPVGVQVEGNDPQDRLELFAIGFKESKYMRRMQTAVKQLAKREFPTYSQWLDGPSRTLNPSELEELASWTDILDRF